MYGIVLFGMPCSGKSTIGKLLSAKYGYKYISSGDIARNMAKDCAEIGVDLRNGKLAPEDMMRVAISNELLKCKKSDSNFILDGFPRFAEQSDWLNEKRLRNVQTISVNIDISEQTAINRASRRNRDDDISIVDRIKYYKDNTYPLAICSDISFNNEAIDGNTKLVDMIYKEVMRYVNNR